MINAPQRLMNIKYAMGTISFDRMARVKSLSLCLQKGSCVNSSEIDGTKLVVLIESLKSSTFHRKHVEIDLNKLQQWNVGATIKPGLHTAVIFVTYFTPDSPEQLDYETTCFKFKTTEADAEKFNKRIQDLNVQRTRKRSAPKTKSPQKQLQAVAGVTPLTALSIIPSLPGPSAQSPVPPRQPAKGRFAKGVELVSTAVMSLLAGLSVKTKL